jgi:hypothetical protein
VIYCFCFFDQELSSLSKNKSLEANLLEWPKKDHFLNDTNLKSFTRIFYVKGTNKTLTKNIAR